jgi:hypothetical protein
MKILDIPQSGKRGLAVSYQSPFGLCSRVHFVPKRTVTPAREHMWRVFGSNSQMWSRTLSEDQRHRWCATGANVMSYPRLGQKGPLTGQQFWQSISSVRGCVGLPADLEPPAPVVFDPSPAGRLIIENGADGVRIYVAVSGDLATDIMVFGQAPCSAGRYKRRNVAYLGLLPPPIGGRSEITSPYKARFGEPRPGEKVFIVTCQTKNGWKDWDQEACEVVPAPPIALQATADTAPGHIPFMHKGCSGDAEGTNQSPPLETPRSKEMVQIGNQAAGAASEGEKEPAKEGDAPG